MYKDADFVVGLVVGTAILGSVSFVYVRHQKLGLNGATLSLIGMILIGMSLWKSIDVGANHKGVWARLEQAEKIAVRASKEAEEAKKETISAIKSVTSLKKTLSTVIDQEKLKAGHLYSGASDGVMNPATKKALERFQQSKGLTRSGELDEATRELLGVRSISD